ncbi:hypothetical protein GM418_02565 [Maribellus comscasis]|uniref:Toxin-antitoxin system YwqK family antitoxin n=1 Tax=Maribellus comscasis TaxID=2681766 RepID=A0A6I6JQS0_9BACT|nr:hypothetical protein [Maribellus comscasis]QGY42572.1 hypothetical protein GM418_02565 [Maribellus comscasis]
MKSYRIILITAIFYFGCQNPKPQVEETVNLTPAKEGITIVTRLYENSATAVEYEIPIVKGTSIKHGIQKRYYQHGSLYSEIPYVAGEREGTAYTYYPVNGNAEPVIWKKQSYKKNKLDGICKRYHRDGTLQAEYEYKDGLPAVGLKEYYQSGNQIKHPDLLLKKVKTLENYYITARLSDGSKNVDFFIGNLAEGKYLPENLKGLQVVKGVGEILIPLTTQNVTITAVKFTDYKNRYIVSKSITF